MASAEYLLDLRSIDLLFAAVTARVISYVDGWQDAIGTAATASAVHAAAALPRILMFIDRSDKN